MFSKFCLSLKPCDHMLAKGPLCSPVNLVVGSILPISYIMFQLKWSILLYLFLIVDFHSTSSIYFVIVKIVVHRLVQVMEPLN